MEGHVFSYLYFHKFLIYFHVFISQILSFLNCILGGLPFSSIWACLHPSTIMISANHVAKAKLNLDVTNETIGAWLLFWFLLIQF
jgi:hypothetical protein